MASCESVHPTSLRGQLAAQASAEASEPSRSTHFSIGSHAGKLQEKAVLLNKKLDALAKLKPPAMWSVTLQINLQNLKSQLAQLESPDPQAPAKASHGPIRTQPWMTACNTHPYLPAGSNGHTSVLEHHEQHVPHSHPSSSSSSMESDNPAQQMTAAALSNGHAQLRPSQQEGPSAPSHTTFSAPGANVASSSIATTHQFPSTPYWAELLPAWNLQQRPLLQQSQQVGTGSALPQAALKPDMPNPYRRLQTLENHGGVARSQSATQSVSPQMPHHSLEQNAQWIRKVQAAEEKRAHLIQPWTEDTNGFVSHSTTHTATKQTSASQAIGKVIAAATKRSREVSGEQIYPPAKVHRSLSRSSGNPL